MALTHKAANSGDSIDILQLVRELAAHGWHSCPLTESCILQYLDLSYAREYTSNRTLLLHGFRR